MIMYRPKPNIYLIWGAPALRAVARFRARYSLGHLRWLALRATLHSAGAIALLLCCLSFGHAQVTDSTRLKPLQVAPAFHKTRFWTVTSVAAVGYSGITIGLDRLWYANYPRSKFHFKDDWPGWMGYDKAGHMFTAYFESRLAAGVYAWTGLKRKQAAWAGAVTGSLFQTSIEILDGFSAEWGWSWGDILSNTAGSALFLGQELAWGEQRICMKFSFHPQNYSGAIIQASNGFGTTSYRDRAEALYGTGLPSIMLKDYNVGTLWLSANISSFLKDDSKFPKWLNIAVGFGAENLYGAERNRWTDERGFDFEADPERYPRYAQFFIAPDIDFTRIPTKKPAVKILLHALNIIKLPAPSLEINTLGKVKWHWMYM
jgi:uncharacterized protein YfiM (DUF2279 family)